MFSALRSSFVSTCSIVSFSRTLQSQSSITLRSRSSLTATAQDVLGTKKATTKQVDGRKVAAVSTLDFTDHSTAFRDKSIWELSRALIVLRLCSYTTFTENSYKIFQTMKNVFGLTITSALVRPLFYNQFVGGVTIPDIKKAVDRMRNAGSGTIILMVLEAIEQQNGAAANHQKITEKMEGSSGQIDNKTGENYMQIRLSALFSVPLLKELSRLKEEAREDFIHSAYRFMKTQNSEDMNSIHLSTPQLYAELKSALLLLEDIGQRALHTNTVLMIDAEYTYMNPALASLAMALALRCNKERPMVWNTTQCYLKKSFDAIKWEYDFLMNNHVCYGAKLVRGAYLVSETSTARSAGYPNPVHDSYDDTGHSYNEKVAWLLSKISDQKNKKRVRFVLATVNQDSINKAVNRMNSLDIAADDNSMIFAQTYGMCDHVTYTLGQAGYPVHKSLAVGSVEEALAYLSRRSQENHSLIVNSGQERQLLKLELKQRVKNKMKMW